RWPQPEPQFRRHAALAAWVVVDRPRSPISRAFRGLAALCAGNTDRSPDVFFRSGACVPAPRRGGGWHHRGYRRCAGPGGKTRAVLHDPAERPPRRVCAVLDDRLAGGPESLNLWATKRCVEGRKMAVNCGQTEADQPLAQTTAAFVVFD